MKKSITYVLALSLMFFSTQGRAWHDETHLAITKIAGYEKWYNAAGADIIKIKAGDVEKKNHFSNNPPETVVTPDIVLNQVYLCNNPDDEKGHLYGALLASIREYRTTTKKGKPAEYHLAFCVPYVGDLSQPLHNTLYNEYYRRNHVAIDGIIKVTAERLYNTEKLSETVVEDVRIIHIGDYDACPCIGEHVSSTGDIGAFRITTTSYADGQLRIRFKLSGSSVAC